MPIRVVFVCLGNICRSPMAHGLFEHMVEEAGLSDQIEVDSAGTSSYHNGEGPHPGTQEVLGEHGIHFQHASRQLTRRDLREADYLIALDRSNLRGISQLGYPTGEVGLLMAFAPQAGIDDVPDPYYSGGFDRVYELVKAGCEGLLAHIRQAEGI
ncbi:MAG: low molecular weight phosphotyrosine protein phosphatase [Chloroflexota bacterium]|jgi:protein-tyrosine phosphatase